MLKYYQYGECVVTRAGHYSVELQLSYPSLFIVSVLALLGIVVGSSEGKTCVHSSVILEMNVLKCQVICKNFV